MTDFILTTTFLSLTAPDLVSKGSAPVTVPRREMSRRERRDQRRYDKARKEAFAADEAALPVRSMTEVENSIRAGASHGEVKEPITWEEMERTRRELQIYLEHKVPGIDGNGPVHGWITLPTTFRRYIAIGYAALCEVMDAAQRERRRS